MSDSDNSQQAAPNRSIRWIAERAKVGHVTVVNYRNQLVKMTNSQQGDTADETDAAPLR